MFEEKLNELYGEIIGKICDMIPIEYEDIHFEGRISDGGGNIYFYFNTIEMKDEFIYYLKIPKKYEVSKEIFFKLYSELFELSKKLYNTFIENGQAVWYSVRMHYNKNGQFKAEYNYIDWFEKGYTDVNIMDYFQYKYLNIIPSSESYLNEMKKMERIENV